MKKTFTLKSTVMAAALMLLGTANGMAASKPSGGSVSGDLVISKVFYSGSTRLNGATPKNYMKHLYIELYNNSANELELQGLYIALTNTDSAANAWTAADMTDETTITPIGATEAISLKDKAVVKQIFQISPDASYVVQPGQSVVIAQCAIDHSEIAEGNVDLSGADFECKSTNNAFNDHNDAVPELKVVKTFGTSDFINFLNPGPDGIVLLAADTDIDSCPTTYPKGKTSGNIYTIIPMYKSIDCVDIVKQKEPSASDKRFTESYDKGYTCTTDPGTYSGQAVVRKTAYVCSDGRVVLFDTNNSSVDFETTDDLALRTYSSTVSGLEDGMQITIPESGYLAINTEKPFCASKELKFVYVNVTNNAATTDMTYNEYDGDDRLLIAGAWIAVGQPGTYTLKYSSSQGVMRTRSSGMVWADEDTKSVSQTTRSFYKFVNETGNIGFKRVAKGDNGYYNNATFSDGDRLYYVISDAIGDKIAAANGATDHTDLEFIAWHGATAATAYEVEASTVAEFNAIETDKTVKFNLNDVRVNAYNPLLYLAYVEDATGVTELNLKKTNITVENGDILSGYIIGTKEVKDLDFMGTYPDMKENVLNKNDYTSNLTLSTTEGEIVSTSATIAEAAAEGNHGKVFTLQDFTVEKTGSRWYAVQNTDKIQLADELNVFDNTYAWPDDMTNVTSLTGVVTYNGVRWQISPLSLASVITGIRGINADAAEAQGSQDNAIYNLQGQRLAGLQKGISIVGGKKVVR